MASITRKDFQPWNQWTEHDVYDEYGCSPRFVHRDESTNRTYWSQSSDTLRSKCAGLLFWTIAAHVSRIAMRVFSFITLYHFSYHHHASTDQSGYSTRVHYSLKERAIEACKDTLKILGTPGLVLFLECAAFYGLFNPYDGRKLYATGERFAYQVLGMEGLELFYFPGPAYCAPCFQPDATHHALGGDSHNGDAW